MNERLTLGMFLANIAVINQIGIFVVACSCLCLLLQFLYSFLVVFVVVPRLKLGFMGSYFPLRIGSGGAPPRRVPQATPGSFLRFHKDSH